MVFTEDQESIELVMHQGLGSSTIHQDFCVERSWNKERERRRDQVWGYTSTYEWGQGNKHNIVSIISFIFNFLAWSSTAHYIISESPFAFSKGIIFVLFVPTTESKGLTCKSRESVKVFLIIEILSCHEWLRARGSRPMSNLEQEARTVGGRWRRVIIISSMEATLTQSTFSSLVFFASCVYAFHSYFTKR